MNVVPLFSISRIDELALREVMKADGAKYIPTLASDRHYPGTVRHLCAMLPKHDSSLHGILFEGVAMAPRLAGCFGLLGNRANATPSLKHVFEVIRSAQGPVGDCVRALLTGVGDCPAALLLRKVVEHRRGEPLEIININSKGEPPPEIQSVIDAEKAHREQTEDDDLVSLPPRRDKGSAKSGGTSVTPRTESELAKRAALKARILELIDEPGANASAVARAHGLNPPTVLRWRARRDAAVKRAAAEAKKTARQRKRAEQCAKHADAISARSARQMERDRESARKLAERTARDRQKRRIKTPDDVRAELCSEADELSERLSYRDRLALEGDA